MQFVAGHSKPSKLGWVWRLVAIKAQVQHWRYAHQGSGHQGSLNIFDPRRNAVLLVAGDKAGQWDVWYRTAIPLAGHRYEDCLKQEASVAVR